MTLPTPNTAYASRTDIEALLLAAFDGVPQPGSRELRLSDEERDALARRFPTAEFTPLEASGEKTWYRISISGL